MPKNLRKKFVLYSASEVYINTVIKMNKYILIINFK